MLPFFLSKGRSWPSSIVSLLAARSHPAEEGEETGEAEEAGKEFKPDPPLPIPRMERRRRPRKGFSAG